MIKNCFQKIKTDMTAPERKLLCALIVFDGASVVHSIRMKNVIYALSSALSLFLLLLPVFAEMVFRIRISMDLKGIYYFLVIGGPVLGNVYKFYHYIRPWDKILHFVSGFGIAALGYALPDLMHTGKAGHSRTFKCLFACSFSLAAAAVWEIYEYALDVLFQMDMQNDTVITEISSYMLGETPGTIGTIQDICSVTLNGAPLEQGYIDIGLIDTMKDMILCLLGTVLFLVYAAVNRSKANFAAIRSTAAGA